MAQQKKSRQQPSQSRQVGSANTVYKSSTSERTYESLRHFSRIGDEMYHRLPIEAKGTGPDKPLTEKSRKH